jgi:hypothetical protein
VAVVPSNNNVIRPGRYSSSSIIPAENATGRAFYGSVLSTMDETPLSDTTVIKRSVTGIGITRNRPRIVPVVIPFTIMDWGVGSAPRSVSSNAPGRGDKGYAGEFPCREQDPGHGCNQRRQKETPENIC